MDETSVHILKQYLLYYNYAALITNFYLMFKIRCTGFSQIKLFCVVAPLSTGNNKLKCSSEQGLRQSTAGLASVRSFSSHVPLVSFGMKHQG